ncbi:TetR family transcriptional regulator [Mycobacterium sp. ACS1612]|uniref:TetR/AcrR family transcriptional regulator n=1 Tax=Mycobacterium sp. ACS1612 TaxID=1834117 RepID=UPI0007FE408C|nr:TetR family transcriptional regulator [Mycobacterium sp. ACS1612]OBF41007.1 TetR family transcriptional regulator [Mycobacterium sp. ACS1612]
MTAPKHRPRNAAATREAILESAIRSFARAGYDGVGVRDIAGDAGVTAMMVNRYFGSKEQLFAEAVEVSFAPAAVIGTDAATLAHEAAAALVARTNPDAAPLNPFLIMLRSVSNPRAVEIVRDAIERHVGRRLAGQLPEPGRGIRTDAMLAVIAGVLLMRRVIETRALRDADPDQLVDLLEAVFTAIVEAPLA